ncbi:MAG: hypothetical protein VKL59_19965 [Nostocaceae cyanobacterium]|nr:hypothetical protein [Nostocaceae cyanobacterium]
MFLLRLPSKQLLWLSTNDDLEWSDRFNCRQLRAILAIICQRTANNFLVWSWSLGVSLSYLYNLGEFYYEKPLVEPTNC